MPKLTSIPGCLNGSSYLNEGFRQHLLQRLDGETYLNRDGFTIEGIVDDLVVEWFENKAKRTMDVTDPNMGTLKVMVPGLREDSGKRFMRNRMLVSRFVHGTNVRVSVANLIGPILKQYLCHIFWRLSN